jgi:hypothetical protein
MAGYLTDIFHPSMAWSFCRSIKNDEPGWFLMETHWYRTFTARSGGWEKQECRKCKNLHFWHSSNNTCPYPARVKGFAENQQSDLPDIFTRESVPEPSVNFENSCRGNYCWRAQFLTPRITCKKWRSYFLSGAFSCWGLFSAMMSMTGRLPLCELQCRHAVVKLSKELSPPSDTGCRWSSVALNRVSCLPQ